MKTLTGTAENPEREPDDGGAAIFAAYRAEHGRLTGAVSSVLRRAASLTGRTSRSA